MKRLLEQLIQLDVEHIFFVIAVSWRIFPLLINNDNGEEGNKKRRLGLEIDGIWICWTRHSPIIIEHQRSSELFSSNYSLESQNGHRDTLVTSVPDKRAQKHLSGAIIQIVTKSYPFYMWWSFCWFREDHFRKVHGSKPREESLELVFVDEEAVGTADTVGCGAKVLRGSSGWRIFPLLLDQQ
ncbi:uncharacterized protein LOC107002627 isoform X2 [Solanum pennellii]|uniref:Uncharacterized protein LOC107002627 isoform X2 n=1 Tax=Solanum pennellii TaxID=28526 RepID=A0ABM1VDA2_SOLPN|nr:uncharacterized protein LOC107002627 isoform X2 [Solanum pennellii]